MDELLKYFPLLTPKQINQFAKMGDLYLQWNQKINVISRKDTDDFYLKHVLHSLSVAKFVQFKAGTSVLDVGTGGGFPGIPLAIMFPEVKFHLVDSIGKKIKVVKEVASELGLKNVLAQNIRAEQIQGTFDFVVSRAVTQMPKLLEITHGKVSSKSQNEIKNGLICLKGGDLEQEFEGIKITKVLNLSTYFEESFFETKKI
ncbi:MAG: 16S rRNA (guanine(527)-N(7))-methyltransferase RsmG [Flavobacteriaceae bacterium]|nr:MAG: 16S rRNA (guanine(527)-N(7))-methyltransferase RsmG [Flavobacteriaceae bacterium]